MKIKAALKKLLKATGELDFTVETNGTVRVFLNNHPSPMLNLPRDAGVTMPLEPLTSDRRAAI